MPSWPTNNFPWASERASGTSAAGRKITTRLGSNCLLISSSIKQSLAKRQGPSTNRISPVPWLSARWRSSRRRRRCFPYGTTGTWFTCRTNLSATTCPTPRFSWNPAWIVSTFLLPVDYNWPIISSSLINLLSWIMSSNITNGSKTKSLFLKMKKFAPLLGSPYSMTKRPAAPRLMLSAKLSPLSRMAVGLRLHRPAAACSTAARHRLLCFYSPPLYSQSPNLEVPGPATSRAGRPPAHPG